MRTSPPCPLARYVCSKCLLSAWLTQLVLSRSVIICTAAQVRPPPIPSPFAPREELEAAKVARRSHPLYASVCLGLLTEIVNSRLFTTVRATRCI